MSTNVKLNGECLCGEVKWEAEGPFSFFGMCQCSLCRKVTGSAFASNLFCPEEQFNWIEGEENRLLYRMPEPRRYGNATCKTCGSRVPNVIKASGRVLMPLGSTMTDPGLEPTLVCIEDHTEWFGDLSAALPKS